MPYRQSAEQMLNLLQSKDLITREDEGRACRLHPLVRRVLLSEYITATQLREIHAVAAAYFQQQIDIKPQEADRAALEAVYHLNETGDYQAACNLFFAQNLQEKLNLRGAATTLIDFYSVWTLEGRLDEGTRGAVLGNLGNAYRDLGQVELAIQHYQQALAIAKEIGDRRGEGAVLGNLGLAYRNLGQVELAIQHYQQALAIAKEIGDRRGEGSDLGNLGNAYKELGDMSRALAHWRHSQAIFEAIKSPNAEKVQGLIDQMKAEQGAEAFARWWAESEEHYKWIREG